MSPLVKVDGLIASLNTTVKDIGNALVGIGLTHSLLMVTLGAPVSYRTLLSVEVDAVFPFPPRSCTAPAAMIGTTVPCTVTAVACTVHVILSEVVGVLQVIPLAVPLPLWVISVLVNVAGLIALLNTTVNDMGSEPVGSDCRRPG